MPKEKQIAAVFGADPGKSTGVAWALIDLTCDTVKEAMRKCEGESKTITGHYREQAVEIGTLFTVLRYKWNVEMGISLNNIHWAMEDFILRLPARSMKREGLYPVWVAAALEGVLMDIAVPEYQQPSEAKHFGSDKRLRAWDKWIVGKVHERDAWRHVGLRVNAIL